VRSTRSPSRIEPLNDRHDRASFTCGVAVLDRYLREQAGQDLRRNLSAIFVLCGSADDGILGYYTLSSGQIEPLTLPAAMAKKLPRRPLPATLLGRLAVDARYHGQGIGGELLVNALTRAAVASRDIGSMAVIVDAKDDRARAFYERYGFLRFEDDPYRLFLPMADAERIAEVTRRA
jgi:ribosomal protein S18 acetylase RimI-like enzyme